MMLEATRFSKDLNKLILLLVLLSCSCTKDKTTNIMQAANTETATESNSSNPLTSLLSYKEAIEKQKIRTIYNSVIRGIRPDMPPDSLQKVLQSIHYWDQVYRDSLMEGGTWITDEIKRKEYRKQMASLDQMNQQIVLHLFDTIGGWPDTKDMGDEASMAIWLVIQHNYNTTEFSRQMLPYLDKAYSTDSVISNMQYAGLFDRVNYKVNGYSKYGTYGYSKEYPPDTVRTSINLERTAIGLDQL